MSRCRKEISEIRMKLSNPNRKLSSAIGNALTVRKFNPGTLQSDEEVIAQFVGREHELESIVDILRENVTSSSCQHILIVGPRGRGKTMLLSRTEAEINRTPELKSHLLPVRLMEENHEIYDITSFWFEILFQLAKSVHSNDPNLAMRLNESLAGMQSRWVDSTVQEAARATVMDAIDSLGKKLVLMIENLQSLIPTDAEDLGWQIREILQVEENVILVATATSFSREFNEPDKPFFEIFRTLELPPLNTGECLDLWHRIRGENSMVAREIRPLEILTGGNPRLLLIVAEFSRHQYFRRLMEELVVLVDENTDYFRGHLDSLPQSERRMYIALLDLWQASTTREIADRARMDIRPASALLGRLQKRGVVIVDEASINGRKLFRIAEPLYSVYYKIRRERDESSVVENLINFMIAFYDVPKVFDLNEAMSDETPRHRSLFSGIDRVLADRSHAQDGNLESVRSFLVSSNEAYKNQAHQPAFDALLNQVQQSMNSGEWNQVRLSVEEYLQSSRSLSLEGISEGEWSYLIQAKTLASSMLEDYETVIQCGNDVVARSMTKDEFVQINYLSTLNLAIGSALSSKEHDRVISFVDSLVRRYDEFPVPECRNFVAAGLVGMARAAIEVQSVSDALSAVDELVSRFGSTEDLELKLNVALGLVVRLIVQLDRLDDEGVLRTSEQLNEVARDFDTTDKCWFGGMALIGRAFQHGRNREFEMEISNYRDICLLLRDVDDERLQAIRIEALGSMCLRQSELGLVSDTSESCDEAERLLDQTEGLDDQLVQLRWRVNCARTLVLLAQGEVAGAIEAFEYGYAEFPRHQFVSVADVLRHVFNLIAMGAPIADLRDVLTRNLETSELFAPLISALRQMCGESVSAPVEVLSVADDVRDHIVNRSQKGVVTAFGY